MRLRKLELRFEELGLTQSQPRHRYVAWSLGQVCQRWQPFPALATKRPMFGVAPGYARDEHSRHL